YQDRRRMLLYVTIAALGSALGSIPLYIIGYLGGETVLRKRISEERFLRIHRSFEQHEFWALMFPGMLPPPVPFKIFVLGAAVLDIMSPLKPRGYISGHTAQTAKLLIRKNETELAKAAPTTRQNPDFPRKVVPSSRMAAYQAQVTK